MILFVLGELKMLEFLIAAVVYNGYVFDWERGMIITTPSGQTITQKSNVQGCPNFEDEGYRYFIAWVDNGSQMPDNCLE